MDRAAEADNMTCFRRVQYSKAAGSFYMHEVQHFDCSAGKMELKNQYFDPANTRANTIFSFSSAAAWINGGGPGLAAQINDQ